MDNKMEQRANIKFCLKLGKTLSETRNMLKKVHGKDCIRPSTVHKWYKRFDEGREDISDANGRPRTSHTPENVEKVLEILQSDPYVSTSVIVELTGIHQITVYRILNDLGKQRVCERFVPRTLTKDQKDARVEHCKDMLEAAKSDSNFMKNIVTSGRIWIFQYEPLTEQQNASTSECQSAEKTKPKEMCMQKSKTLLTVFFDSKGMVYKEFIPEDQTVNADYYLGILERFWDSISRDRPQYEKPGSWCLLHDNTLAHKSKIVRDFLVKKGITALEYPPHSPDLTPFDFWLFPILKPMIKEMRYNNIKDMENALTEALEMIQKEGYNYCFKDLFNRRLQCCIDSNGDEHIKNL